MTHLWLVLPALGCPLALAAALWVLLRPTENRDQRVNGDDLRQEAAAFRARLTATEHARSDALSLPPGPAHGRDLGPTVGTAR